MSEEAATRALLFYMENAYETFSQQRINTNDGFMRGDDNRAFFHRQLVVRRFRLLLCQYFSFEEISFVDVSLRWGARRLFNLF